MCSLLELNVWVDVVRDYRTEVLNVGFHVWGFNRRLSLPTMFTSLKFMFYADFIGLELILNAGLTVS